MNNDKIKKYLPYISAVLLFLILSFIYFPEVIEGKQLNQHDKQTWKGSSHEIYQYKEKTGEHSQWTNSMFSGMPSYLVTNYAPNNIAAKIYREIDFRHKLRPASYVFLYLIGFFIALLFFGVNPWLSIVGALAFGFSSYFFIIIEAGHITKVFALAFMTPIVAGIYHAYKKNALAGALLSMVFLSLQLSVNHLQVTYYTLLIVLIYMIFEVIETVREKSYQKFIKSSAFLFVAAMIAVMVNFSAIITTYDYGKDSIRGKSELTFNEGNKTSGLDRDYATAWSYGKAETFNMLIANMYGGASGSELSTSSHMYKTLSEGGYKNPEAAIKSMPTYWGLQPFTSGPVYIGALVIFLFVLGLFLVRGAIKWWLLTATILSILLAWGKYFAPLTDFFLDYFPMYNKFRTVSMILVIAEMTMPLLGILALKNIIEKKSSKEEIFKAVKYSVAILGGLILILLIPGLLSFESAGDSRYLPENLIPALEADRASMFRMDALRSLLLIFVGAGIIWAYINEKIKLHVLYVVIGLAVLVDLWSVNKRYLNSNDFVEAFTAKTPFKKSAADKSILTDKALDYRVLNLAVSTFNDASTSYFHKSIGGYHGAKMRRYQELIDYKISDDISNLKSVFNDKLTDSILYAKLSELSTLNMLNTKYFILNPNAPAVSNPYTYGNAWFVKNIKVVENADEEICGLYNPDKIQEVKQILKEKETTESKIKNMQSEIQTLQKQKNKSSEINKIKNELNKIYQEYGIASAKLTELTNFNPKETAVVNKKFAEQVKGFTYQPDSTASIKLLSYAPNKLVYESTAKTDQIAVFSEIFYAKGWNAYVNGKLTPHFRADYVLRAMKIPAGKNKIEFKFEPQIWKTGNTVSLIGSIIFILLLLGGIAFEIKKKANNSQKESAN